jgi:hypothetical protein
VGLEGALQGGTAHLHRAYAVRGTRVCVSAPPLSVSPLCTAPCYSRTPPALSQPPSSLPSAATTCGFSQLMRQRLVRAAESARVDSHLKGEVELAREHAAASNEVSESIRWEPAKAPRWEPVTAPRWALARAPHWEPAKAPRWEPVTAPRWALARAPHWEPAKAPRWEPVTAPRWALARAPRSEPAQALHSAPRSACATAMCKSVRIATLSFGTARQKMVHERWTNHKLQRRACTPGTGYRRVEGNRRASRNGPRE